MPKRRVFMNVTIDPDLFQEIERLRGREKRSTFVEHLLRTAIRELEKGKDGRVG